MLRLNLMLLLAVLVSAFYLVHTQYESRRLFVDLERGTTESRKLAAEHEQLRVQKREQATSARVQQLATQKLKMRPVSPAITEYVSVQTQAPAAPNVPAQPLQPAQGSKP